MCGIAGIGHVPEARWPEAMDRLGRIVGPLRKRGPDGMALFSESGFALVQTLLLITDPVSGMAPYFSEDRRIVAVVNGEIYNHRALRAELGRIGYRFTSDSDCEVVANGFAVYGPCFFERIRGMFALAVLDRERRVVTLARDSFGIRQLYYSRSQGILAFSSEPQPLVAAGLASADPDEEALVDAMVLRQPLEPKTMYRDVWAVPPGHFIEFDGQAAREHRFAPDPFAARGFESTSVPGNDSAPLLRQAVREAVDLRIPRDCRYATFLSGGIDSGIVSALAPRGDSLRLPSLVCGFDDESVPDERLQARGLALRLGVPLHEMTLAPSAFFATWPYLIADTGAPLMFNSTMPIHAMCRRARQEGAKVLLSGEGSDEIFLGYRHYPRYSQAKDDGSLEFLLQDDPEFNHPATDLGPVLASGGLAPHLLGSLRERVNSLAPVKPGQTGLDRKLRFDRLTFLQSLLVRQDRSGLGCGVEIRVPFLDREVVSLARAWPVHEQISAASNKRLLRRAFAATLGPFAKAGKIGFPVPVLRWLSLEDFRALIDLLDSSLSISGLFRKHALKRCIEEATSHPAISGTKVWTLLNLAAWTLYQKAGDGLFELWGEHLDFAGRRIMEELDYERCNATPAWMGGLLRRCASTRQAATFISPSWLEPVERDCSRALDVQRTGT